MAGMPQSNQLGIMATQQVKILVIGGKQAQGHGLRAGQCYVEQLARRIEQTGKRVFVEYHVPVDLSMATSILYYLNVYRYDLIILQMGHQYVSYPFQLNEVDNSSNNNQRWQQVFGTIKALALTISNKIKRVPRLQDVILHLSDTLHYLQPYNHKVILMTPFPHMEAVTNWYHQETRKLFCKMGASYGTPVLDTYELIHRSTEFFLPNDSEQLSPVGHELIGCALFDAYQSLRVPQSNESHPFGPQLPRGY